MKSDNDQIALQGIEFWSTVCDEEADLSIEAMEVGSPYYALHKWKNHSSKWRGDIGMHCFPQGNIQTGCL